ncbi:HAD family hydrolase [Arthrobacter woluwensis]|uniref:HAD family hydrolase n=1 Tax=Arthrobacter woluwensis TaxID=156980 RepID=UPI00381D868B
MTTSLNMSIWDGTEALLFDLDGVLTPTALAHEQAWRTLFEDVLAVEGVGPEYTDADYYAHIDGRPRYDGVREFLASRGLTLPEGQDDDAPTERTVRGLGNLKNRLFAQIIEDGIEPYPGSSRFVAAARERGVKLAVVSSSRNAPAVLEAAGMAELFPIVVDGNVAAREGLPGKPHPATFLRAAELLGVDPAAATVVEDAVSGVEAGAAGGFRAVIGVDRGAGEDVLRSAGATLVVSDLDELLPA